MKLKKFERKDRYGNMISMEFDTEGLPVPMLQEIPMVYDHPGEPKGTDTVPAWLTPGEFVVNKEATDMYGDVIEKMNDHGREIQDAKMHDGGSVEGGKYHPVHRSEGGYSIVDTIKQIPGYMWGEGRRGGKAKEAMQDYREEIKRRRNQEEGLLSKITNYFEDGGNVPMPQPRPPYLAASSIYDRLRDRGFSHNAAVGIVANFETESGFNPGAKQHNQKYANKYKSDGSKNPNFGVKPVDSYFPGQGYGLAQWTESRRDDLKKFAADKDMPMDDINTQLDFMMQEMGGEFKNVRDNLSNSQSPEAATQYFLQDYEKAGKPASERRMQYAREFSDFITNQKGEDPAPQVPLPPSNQESPPRPVDDGSRPPTLLETLFGGLPIFNQSRQGSFVDYKQLGGEMVDPTDLVTGVRGMRSNIPEFNYGIQQAELYDRAVGDSADDLGTAPTGVPVASQAPPEPKDLPFASNIMKDPDVERAVLRAESEVAKDTTDREDLGTVPTMVAPPEKDGDDLGTAPTAPPKPVVERADPRQFGDTPEARMDYNTENSEAYQAYLRRARSAGVKPKSPSEWREYNTPDKTGESQSSRHAILSGASESQTQALEDNQAAAEVLNEGGSSSDANTASNMTPTTEPDKETKKSETIASIIQKGQNHTGPAEDQPGDNSDAGSVQNEGDKQDDGKKKEAESMFKSLFGDLFDKKELARMAVMYLGSRAMGYSHQGSMGFAAKNYITRVDAKVANRDKFLQTNVGKFTPDSLELYRETGKISDLIPVGKPIQRKGEYKTFYGEGGKKITGEKVVQGDNTFYVDQNGKVINQYNYREDERDVPGTEAYESRVSSNSKDNVAIIKSMKTKIGEGKDGSAMYKTDINPEVEGRKVAEWAVKNGVDMERVGGLLQLAMQDAINDDRQDGSRAQSLIPYLDSLVIREKTEYPDLFMVGEGDDRQAVDPEQFMALNDDVAFVMQQIGGKGSNFVLANQYYTQAIKEWNNTLTDDDRKQYTRMAKGTGLSPFMVFVQKDLADFMAKTQGVTVKTAE